MSMPLRKAAAAALPLILFGAACVWAASPGVAPSGAGSGLPSSAASNLATQSALNPKVAEDSVSSAPKKAHKTKKTKQSGASGKSSSPTP